MTRNPDFTQVVVWPSTVVGNDKINEFVDFMKSEFGVRAQYLEEIVTTPDLDRNGDPLPGTGGRNDLFFAVHKEDISGSFCISRLKAGMRWVEDVLGNGGGNLYPVHVAEYQSW